MREPSGSLDYVVSLDARLCRAGAPVENLAHSASFHSPDKIAPSNHGIKHLGWRNSRPFAINLAKTPTAPKACWRTQEQPSPRIACHIRPAGAQKNARRGRRGTVATTFVPWPNASRSTSGKSALWARKGRCSARSATLRRENGGFWGAQFCSEVAHQSG